MSRPGIKNDTLTQSLWVLSILITVLLLLSLLPEINIGIVHLKKMDILSDLRPDPPAIIPIKTDSIPLTKKDTLITITSISSSPEIEDFSEHGKTLNQFYKALRQVHRQQVRIAFYGDSFIEGDIISASFRDTLQKVFGGNGVGLVPLASETTGFRKSVKHTFTDWNTYSLISPPQEGIPIGISGYTFRPEENNTVTYKPGNVPPQHNFKNVKFLYQNLGPASLHYTINDEPEMSKTLNTSDSIQQTTITHDDIQSIQFHVTPGEQLYFFGVSFEEQHGVYVDNFSLRRNSGIALSRLSPSLLKQFNKYLDYKLIILQYGLNVASATDSTRYQWYSTKMITIIKNLKEIFPETNFLLLSVSDRGVNQDGDIVTMEAIPKLRTVQREIARKSGIAFWDMYEAMGGKNSIARYTDATPPLAAKDYTHLTHLGGNKIGKKLAESILQGINKHEK